MIAYSMSIWKIISATQLGYILVWFSFRCDNYLTKFIIFANIYNKKIIDS